MSPAETVQALKQIAARCPTDSPDYTLASVGDSLRALLAQLQTAGAKPEPVWCSCGDGIVADSGALCGTCASLAAPPSVPSDLLYDGYAVWQAMDDRGKSRTSAENVGDVLDAIARLVRAPAPAERKQPNE